MKTIIIIVLIFLFSSFLYADTIYLKDGSKVEGEIKTVSENEIVINVPVKGFEGIYEPKTIMQADVNRIKREKTKSEEKTKEPKKIKQSQDNKVLYRGKWISPKEKEELEKEVEEQCAKEVELANKRKIENAVKRLEIYKGMNRQQVKKVWGKPDNIRMDVDREEWAYYHWRYVITKAGVSCTSFSTTESFSGRVYFDKNGKVENYVNNSGYGRGYLLPKDVRDYLIKNNMTADRLIRTRK